MLTFEEAKKIGVNACAERLGKDFVNRYKNSSCPAYADMDSYAYCFLGVDDSPNRNDMRNVKITSNDSFPYVARCTVRYNDGKIEYLECTIPESAH